MTKFPQSFSGAGVHCGIKSAAGKQDLSLLISDRPAVAAGVYTRNMFKAASVRLNQPRTPGEGFRGVVINSGNANACTGERGDKDAAEMAQLAANACGAQPEQMLVMSTGIIGEHLPMENISQGIAAAGGKLGSDQASLTDAARGMMTTDTVEKIRGREVTLGENVCQVTGLAKGAAMIGPNMATMLSVVMTDANVSAADAQAALSEAVVESFNCISVDGHSSTNDSVLLLGNGAAGGPPLADKALADFKTTLLEVCEDLAQSIPADGEGATHLITIEVHGCKSHQDAVQIARTVADSPLVKTAIAGADPNWGRIVSAAGYAGVPFDPDGVTLLINGLLLYEAGTPVTFDEAEVSASIKENRDTGIVLLMSEGTASARFWTTDLTAEYVRLNADYHT